jgi:hypothetical protein
MGKPKGLARSARAPAQKSPATAAFFDAFLKNSLLEIVDIHTSLRVESGRSMFSQSAVLSHDSETMLRLHSCRQTKQNGLKLDAATNAAVFERLETIQRLDVFYDLA